MIGSTGAMYFQTQLRARRLECEELKRTIAARDQEIAELRKELARVKAFGADPVPGMHNV